MTLLLVFFLLLQSSAEALDLLAKEVILVDFDRGQILLEQEAHKPMYPSSMTKIMTSYLAFEALQKRTFTLDNKFLVSNKAWKMGGSKMFIKIGDSVTLEDLLKGIIVVSGNDACITLAEGFYGDEELFVEKMNEKAQVLKMTQTHFVNATGWPNPEHITSAVDLAKLSVALIKDFPDYYQYHSLQSFFYNQIKQNNRNLLLGRLGVDGIKTGHTDLAGYGIVLSAKDHNRRIILVLNGLKSEKARALEGEKIINYGFKGFKEIDLAEAITLPTIPVIYGEAAEIPIKFKKPFKLYAKNNQTFDCEMTRATLVKGPVFLGDKVGTLACKVPNLYGEIMEEDLVAAISLEGATFLQKLLYNLYYFFTGSR